ncbi:MAG TPA: hypothetical protein VN578_24225 [Candidatus Binatia bacterium]|nr:hypothetical protein [Candidatus Binatia bacterium]
MLALLLTLFAFALRFYRLSNQSLWTDEVSSIEVALAPLDQIYQQSAALNNSLPTYFLLLRSVLNDRRTDVEFRARSLSALAGSLSIPVFIGLVYLWRRREGAALLAGLLLAINPLHIWYSQEVRAYALMLFFGLLCLVFFELARVSLKARWSGLYVASAFAAIALHKTGLVFPAVCALWHGWSLAAKRQPARQWLIHVPIGIAAVIVLALKSYPPAEEYSRRTSGLEVLYTFITFVGGYSFGPSLTAIQWHGPWAAVSRHLPQVALAAAALALVALTCLLNWRQFLLEETKDFPRPSREVVLFTLGIAIVAVYGLLSGFPYNVRYALPALFGFLALLAAFATTTNKSALARISVASVLMLGLWADAQWFYNFSYRKGDSRAVARWLVQNQDQVKSWTVLPGYLSRSVEWYLHENPEVLIHSIPAKQDRTTSFPPVPDVLIIGRRHHLSDPDKIVAEYKSAAGQLHTDNSFAGFELYVRDVAAAIPSGSPRPAIRSP